MVGAEVGVRGPDEHCDHRLRQGRDKAQNRLSVWGVSWESPLPASQGSSILFTKRSAHTETRTVWIPRYRGWRGVGGGRPGVRFEVLKASLTMPGRRARSGGAHNEPGRGRKAMAGLRAGGGSSLLGAPHPKQLQPGR